MLYCVQSNTYPDFTCYVYQTSIQLISGLLIKLWFFIKLVWLALVLFSALHSFFAFQLNHLSFFPLLPLCCPLLNLTLHLPFVGPLELLSFLGLADYLLTFGWEFARAHRPDCPRWNVPLHIAVLDKYSKPRANYSMNIFSLLSCLLSAILRSPVR